MKEKEPQFFYTFYQNVLDSGVLKRLCGYKAVVYMCCNMKRNHNTITLDLALKQEICKVIGVKMQTLANELSKLRKEYVISVTGKECMINPAFFWYGDLPKRKKMMLNKQIQDRFNFEIEK